MPILEASQLHKKYGALEVLKGVDMQVERGEIVSIVGSSGAGKSTLLHLLGTLDVPDTGRVRIADTETTALSGSRLSRFRNKHLGFVFQFHHLLPEFTALENVCIPGWIAGQPKGAVEKRATELLHLLGLSARTTHKPTALSGGEQQRVAVARALINNPSVVFADEPTGNLDSLNARDLHQLFFDLRRDLQQTFIIVTHNEELAGMADRTIHMQDGRVV